jgi:hypothetical protein
VLGRASPIQLSHPPPHGQTEILSPVGKGMRYGRHFGEDDPKYSYVVLAVEESEVTAAAEYYNQIIWSGYSPS